MGIIQWRNHHSDAAYQAPQFDHYTDVFRSGNFEKATIQQRMDAYQALEHDMALREGRPERQLVFEDLPAGKDGTYKPANDTLIISSKFLCSDCNPFDGMNTVIHEGRHAYQYDCMNGRCKPDAQMRDHLAAMKLEDLVDLTGKRESLYDYGKNLENPSEFDAWTYANRVMNEFGSTYRNDLLFENSIKNDNSYVNGHTNQLSKEAMYSAQQNAQSGEFLQRNHTVTNPEQTRVQAANYADDCIENTARERGYSNERIESVKQHEYTPTKAQQATYKKEGTRKLQPKNHSHNKGLSKIDTPGTASAKDYVLPNKNEEGNNKQPVSQETVPNSLLGQAPSEQAKMNAQDSLGNIAHTQPGGMVKTINASEINMDTAMGMDDPNFWHHHSNTKQDYMNLAENLPEIQDRLNQGETFEQIKSDPQLHDAAMAYYDPEKMIKVERNEQGGYDFIDDGRHRVEAAKELGCDVPVYVTNEQAPAMSEGFNQTQISATGAETYGVAGEALPPTLPGLTDEPVESNTNTPVNATTENQPQGEDNAQDQPERLDFYDNPAQGEGNAQNQPEHLGFGENPEQGEFGAKPVTFTGQESGNTTHLEDGDQAPNTQAGQLPQEFAQNDLAGHASAEQQDQQAPQDNMAGQQPTAQEGQAPQNDWQSIMAGEEPGAQNAAQPHYADADQANSDQAKPAPQQSAQDNMAGQQPAAQEGQAPQNDWQSIMAGEEPGAQNAAQPHYADADQAPDSGGTRSGQNAIGSKTPGIQQDSAPEPEMGGGMSM